MMHDDGDRVEVAYILRRKGCDFRGPAKQRLRIYRHERSRQPTKIYRHFRVIVATATVAMTTLNGYHSNGYHSNVNEVVGW